MPADCSAFRPGTERTADLVYGAPDRDSAGLPLTVSIFADRGHLRAQMSEDVQAAGLRVAIASDVADLFSKAVRSLGDIVLVDCPRADASTLAALSRLDMRAAHAGSRLIVSTSIDALDDVFGCIDQSGAQLLVEPSRADRVIALGQVLAHSTAARLRELSEEDRLMLLRLTQQVGQIAAQINRLNAGAGLSTNPHDGDPAFEEGKRAFRFGEGDGGGYGGKQGTEGLIRAVRPPLPDPRLVRKIIRQRRLRSRFFDGDLFSDPAWDMLLDLTAARAEHNRVSVTSLCIASNVPPTTALRWIAQMSDAGLFERVQDDTDRRRAFIALTDKAADAMARYFVELGAARQKAGAV